MCHGHLDPKFVHRDIEAGLGGSVRLHLPFVGLFGTLRAALRPAAKAALPHPARDAAGSVPATTGESLA